MTGVLEKIFEDSLTLIADLNDKSVDSRDRMIIEFLEQNKGSLSIGDFESGLEWFNVSKPLSLEKDLRGKLVVLDFFTYCCINCLHILPKLKSIEEKFNIKDGLIVIGVHSAKFENEKDSKNIMSALQRYGISHPVVNDSEGIMWSALGIPCWPTLLVLSPSGNPIFVAVGESNMPELERFVKASMHFYHQNNELSTLDIETSSLAHIQGSGPLFFPGKVACCRNGDHLAIADTGHHRILICSNRGNVQHIAGGMEPGYIDGKFSSARFHSPQGVAFLNCEVLYVADTDNNAIRKMNIAAQEVETVVPSGEKGDNSSCPSSPWDLCVLPDDSCIIIAAAGCHRLWGFFLRDVSWWRKTTMHGGMCVPIAGNGREENRNNAYAHAAAFAQPSGICHSPALNSLFVADSESSSIRKVDLKDGCVSAMVGGGRDPTDLFCYGDVDGSQWNVRLQHPLGVAWCSNRNELYVADSYNHKVKVVKCENRSCRSILGSGYRGDSIESGNEQFNEPGGLCLSPDGSLLFIADTNNNCIKVVHLKSEESLSVEKLDIKLSDKQTRQVVPNKIVNEKINSKGGTVNWRVQFVLLDGLKFTDIPQKWQLLLPNKPGWSSNSQEGEIILDSIELEVTVPPGDKNNVPNVFLEATLFLCNSIGTCQRNRLCFALCLEYDDDAPGQIVCKLSNDVGQNKMM